MALYNRNRLRATAEVMRCAIESRVRGLGNGLPRASGSPDTARRRRELQAKREHEAAIRDL